MHHPTPPSTPFHPHLHTKSPQSPSPHGLRIDILIRRRKSATKRKINGEMEIVDPLLGKEMGGSATSYSPHTHNRSQGAGSSRLPMDSSSTSLFYKKGKTETTNQWRCRNSRPLARGCGASFHHPPQSTTKTSRSQCNDL